MKRNFRLLLLLIIFNVTYFSSLSARENLPLNAIDKRVNLKEQLSKLEDVISVERVSSEVFNEKYVVTIKQLLDHKDSSAGFFGQRFIVSHISDDAPVVMVTEGYRGDYGLNPYYREEISARYNTNMVFVEHRYFSKSTPRPRNWNYLTAYNSACDLHKINSVMRQIYTDNKWISTGISKGGQTTIIYKTYFPDDVDISVPYVAPVCFGVEDGRHEPFIDKCSTKEDRKLIRDFQLLVLSKRDKMLPLLKEYSKKENYKYAVSLDEVFDYCVLEYPFALWQWGTSRSTIPSSESNDTTLFNHLMDIAGSSYFAINDEPSFFVQAAKELGYYGYETKPFKSLLYIKTSKNYLHRLFLPNDAAYIKFDNTLSKDIYKYLKNNDPKMIFIYGQYDPWTAAGVDDKLFKNKENMIKMVEPNGSHKARIATMPQEMESSIWSTLDKWLGM